MAIDTGGYIRLYRKLLQNPFWTQLSPAVAKIAVYFLLRASYKSMQWYDGTATVEIPAGSFITSLASTAVACNLSVQQVRDAFDHLSRTQFATYRRTRRWTLVTVLNWASYQASLDQQNTQENTVESNDRNRQGTLIKKLRSKEYTPLPPKGVVNGIPSEPDGLPFATLLDSQPEALNGNSHQPAPKNGNGHRRKTPETVQRIAGRNHARHQNERRDIGVGEVARKLDAILKRQHVSASEQEAYLEQIDRVHASMCQSEAWRKDGGQFATGLENWLAPTKERYLTEPPAAAPSQSEPPRMVL
jgi:hypothetical protein